MQQDSQIFFTYQIVILITKFNARIYI